MCSTTLIVCNNVNNVCVYIGCLVILPMDRIGNLPYGDILLTSPIGLGLASLGSGGIQSYFFGIGSCSGWRGNPPSLFFYCYHEGTTLEVDIGFADNKHISNSSSLLQTGLDPMFIGVCNSLSPLCNQLHNET